MGFNRTAEYISFDNLITQSAEISKRKITIPVKIPVTQESSMQGVKMFFM